MSLSLSLWVCVCVCKKWRIGRIYISQEKEREKTTPSGRSTGQQRIADRFPSAPCLMKAYFSSWRSFTSSPLPGLPLEFESVSPDENLFIWFQSSIQSATKTMKLLVDVIFFLSNKKEGTITTTKNNYNLGVAEKKAKYWTGHASLSRFCTAVPNCTWVVSLKYATAQQQTRSWSL